MNLAETNFRPSTSAGRGDFDPRPDLGADHRTWLAVLVVAGERDPNLAGLLHGLRAGGARLEVRKNQRGREFLRLDYRPCLSVADETEHKGAVLCGEAEFRDRWLSPHGAAIKAVFDRALRVMNDALAAMERAEGDKPRPEEAQAPGAGMTTGLAFQKPEAQESARLEPQKPARPDPKPPETPNPQRVTQPRQEALNL